MFTQSHMQAGPAPPSPFLVSSCRSQAWQSNFSGFYTAALCTMLLFPIKLCFLAGLTLLLLGDVRPSSTGGGGELYSPALTTIPAGPHPVPLHPHYQPLE